MYINLDNYLCTKGNGVFETKNGQVVQKPSDGKDFDYEPLNKFLREKGFKGDSILS